MEEMKYCSNCGAPINIHTDKCPHCGYTNIEGAEEKYLNELEEIKDNLAQLRGVSDLPFFMFRLSKIFG